MTKCTRTLRRLGSWAMAILLLLAALPATVLAQQEPTIGMKADVQFVRAGARLNLDAFFEKETVATNAVTLLYTYEGSVFDCIAYTPSDEANVVNEVFEDGFAKLVLIIPDWQTESLGTLTLAVKEDALLEQGQQEISLTVEYVAQQGEDGDKTVHTAQSVFSAQTFGGVSVPPVVEGDTNNDYLVDLLDVSNIVDWFGFSADTDGWEDWYVYFDANENGAIDIFDIVRVSTLLMDDLAAVNSLISYADSLDKAIYTPESWAALQEVLTPAREMTIAKDVDVNQLKTILLQLKAALKGLQKVDTEEGTRIAFAVTPAAAQVDVMDSEGVSMPPTAESPFAFVLLPGSYTYTVSAAGYETKTAALEVADEDATITVALESTTEEYYQITFSLSPPEAIVRVLDNQNAPVSPTKEDPLVYRLLPGTYTYVVNAAGCATITEAFTVSAPTTISVTLGSENPAADKTALQALVDKASSLAEADYTPDSWAALVNALSASTTVLKNQEATQTSVDAAVIELQASIDSLVPVSGGSSAPE